MITSGWTALLNKTLTLYTPLGEKTSLQFKVLPGIVPDKVRLLNIYTGVIDTVHYLTLIDWVSGYYLREEGS